jgi:hypothetical protein
LSLFGRAILDEKTGKSNLDFYQGALPEVYVYLHYLDTRHQSRVVIHNEVKIVYRRTPIKIVFVFLAFIAISLFLHHFLTCTRSF